MGFSSKKNKKIGMAKFVDGFTINGFKSGGNILRVLHSVKISCLLLNFPIVFRKSNNKQQAF